MDRRVGRIGELLEDDAVGNLPVEFLGPGNGALHTLRSLGEHEARAEDFEQLAPLETERLGHGQHEPQTLGCGHEGQRDAGVAAGGFNQDRLLVDAARLERILDHRVADAVLHA